LIAGIEGAGGLEMHYPTEVTDANYKDLKQLAIDLNLEIVQFCPHLWVDPKYKFGQFTNSDQKILNGCVLNRKGNNAAVAANQALNTTAPSPPTNAGTNKASIKRAHILPRLQ
jgi:hypothetical protein